MTEPPAETHETSADTIPSTITGNNPVVTLTANGYGYVSGPSDLDLFRFDVVAGQTYSFHIRGVGANAISDAVVKLYDAQGTLIDSDDDGGRGLDALLTYTASYTGAVYLGATSNWDSGSYELKVVAQGPDEDSSQPAQLIVGETSYGFLGSSEDLDRYSVYLEAGRYYEFRLAGGADYESKSRGALRPGEMDTTLALYDLAGNQLSFGDDEDKDEGDLGSALGFVPQTSGYYHLVVDAKGSQAGGYTLDGRGYVLADLNPLDSIDWGTKLSNPLNITVYFAKAGESFGAEKSIAWTEYEMQQVMLGFERFKQFININVTVTNSAVGATFKMVAVNDPDAKYAGKMGPPGTTNAGVGTFNVAYWDRDGPLIGSGGRNGSLEPGGNSFRTVIHEIGHGLGLAHPHDEGGLSIVMLGVFADSDSYGVFDLNQGIHSTMSYNGGWDLNPFTPTVGFTSGYEDTPGPFDIAVLQKKYGAVERNQGDTVYRLDSNILDGASYHTIWDTGGVDAIVNDSMLAATIDLTAATIDYSPTGGGVVSYIHGIKGGFLIAQGVVIENATGGWANDTIIGNAAANFFDLSRGGDDWALGKGGADAFYFGAAMTAADRVDGGSGGDQVGLQGNYVGFTLGAQSLVGIETLALLSGTDTRFGDSSAGTATRYHYEIITLDANVASGERLIVQAGLLVAGESFSFNGAAEKDGTFLIYGGKGQDTIIGGQLSDGFYFGEGAFALGDKVTGGGGNNDQVALRGNYLGGVIFAVDALDGVETLVLLSGADTRFGAAGAGYGYKVTLDDGNAAAGTTFTVNGALLVEGETLILDGSREKDATLRILSGRGADTLTGGAGNDIIYGGLGADILTGGAGKDVFLYRSADDSTPSGFDRILDFQAGDLIDLSAIDANVATPENDAFAFIGLEAFSGVAGQLRMYQEAGNWMMACDTDGDGAANLLICVATDQNRPLDPGDFVL